MQPNRNLYFPNQAVDHDRGENAELTYQLVHDSSGMFDIDAKEGSLFANSFDNCGVNCAISVRVQDQPGKYVVQNAQVNLLNMCINHSPYSMFRVLR